MARTSEFMIVKLVIIFYNALEILLLCRPAYLKHNGIQEKQL